MPAPRTAPRVEHSATRLWVALVVAVLAHAGLALWISSLAPVDRDVDTGAKRVLPVQLLERIAIPPPDARVAEQEPPAAHSLAASADRDSERAAAAALVEHARDDGERPLIEPASLPGPSSLSLRRPAPTAVEREPSFMEQVLAAGSPGPRPGSTLLARGMDRRDPLVHLFAEGYGQAPATLRDQAGTLLGQLTPTADGGYTYQGSQIRAEIFADGSVVLYDPPHLRAQALGVPVERLPNLLKDPRAELQRALREHRKGLDALGKDQGLPANDDVKDALAMLNFLLTANSISGVFDLTESAMRAVGEDPYATHKTCFLDETATLREQLRSQHLARVQRSALDGLQSHLCAVWADTTRSAAERRATIFELWDECDDTDGGREAQAIVLRFIEQHLPAGDVDAYAAAELLALNARRTSAALFAPYH